MRAAGTTVCGYRDCRAEIPNRYGAQGVSMSRYRSSVLICSKCGVREAFKVSRLRDLDPPPHMAGKAVQS